MLKFATVLAAAALVVAPNVGLAKSARPKASTLTLSVGAQYDTTHVYVAPEDFDRFMDAFVATFGGTKSPQGVFQVTPTPSQTISQLAYTPVGTISVFGFKTPIPHPFGVERTGYLITDMDVALKAARANGADVQVADFPDPIGRDAVVEWPGGVHMQLYWHAKAPRYEALKTIPENRVYVSGDRADAFVKSWLGFSHGKVLSDDRDVPGVEIGIAGETFRRIRLQSGFGKITVLVSKGHLPFPFGHEMTGYEVSSLPETLERAKAAGVTVLVAPFTSGGRNATIVEFPGGYIAEIHSVAAH